MIRLPKRLLVAAVAVLLAGVCIPVGGAWLYGEAKDALNPDFESMPDGLLSDPVWAGHQIYFIRDPLFASGGASQLWRVSPGGNAAPVRLSGSCAGGDVSALTSQGDGKLSVTSDCGEHYEVLVLDTRTEKITVRSVSKAPGSSTAINRVLWDGPNLIVSGDGYKCSAIGVVHDDEVSSMPPVATQHGELPLSNSYKRARGDCKDLPMAGFVARTPSSILFMASTSAIGVDPDDRDHVEWDIYSTRDNWKTARRLVSGLRAPEDVAQFGNCMLVSAVRGVSGIWLVSPGHSRPKLVAKGQFPSFAIDDAGEKLVVLDQSAESDSLVLLEPATMDLRQRCKGAGG